MLMLIRNTDETARHPWPDGTFIQGGSRGLVIGRTAGSSYTTAFVEVFIEGSFIRGEGATIVEAETAAWAKHRSNSECPGHEYEPRVYTNGVGFCKHCDHFNSKAFTAEQLGLRCHVCSAFTNWSRAGNDFFCKEHAPTREQRRALDAAAGIPPSPLEGLFDRFSLD